MSENILPNYLDPFHTSILCIVYLVCGPFKSLSVEWALNRFDSSRKDGKDTGVQESL